MKSNRVPFRCLQDCILSLDSIGYLSLAIRFKDLMKNKVRGAS